MKAVTKLMIGAAGVAALGVATPAAAQYYPGSGYGYGGYNQPANVIGQVLQSVINPYANQQRYANQQSYALNPQVAAQRCSAAVQQRLAQQYRGYGYAQTSPRVLGITDIDQRSRSMLRLSGYATSGTMAYNNYGAYGYGAYGATGYGYAQAPADLSFRCDVDYRGYVRDIDIDRRR